MLTSPQLAGIQSLSKTDALLLTSITLRKANADIKTIYLITPT